MSSPPTSNTLDMILKAMMIFNTMKPVLDEALFNEAERLGLTREQRHALTKRLNNETKLITAEDASDNP